MNRAGKFAVAVLIFATAALGAMIYFYHEEGTVWTNDAFIEGYSMDLSSNVTEEVIALFAEEGDFVRAGQRIAQLQNNVPLAQKAAQEAKIESLEQEVKVKEANFKKIYNDYIRAQEGIETKVISPQSFDHSEKNSEMAEAELQLARANLKRAQKELEVIEAELTHYTIFAPQDGTIAKRWVWVGDVPTAGQSLYTMYDLDRVWVTANLEETKIEHIKLGDPVEIHVDAYPHHTFQGKIFTIKGAAASQFSLVPQNNATGNFTKVAQRIPVKMTIEPPDDFPKNQPLYLFPGMNTEVTIRVGQ